MQGLANKVCLITGAGSGLGRASALALAGSGSRLAVADINAESAQETVSMIDSSGGQGVAIHVDVSDSTSVQLMVEAVESAYGGIDILVNNAGVVGELKPLHEVSEESWDFVQSVDMKGVFLCSKFTIPGMLKHQCRFGVRFHCQQNWRGVHRCKTWCHRANEADSLRLRPPRYSRCRHWSRRDRNSVNRRVDL